MFLFTFFLGGGVIFDRYNFFLIFFWERAFFRDSGVRIGGGWSWGVEISGFGSYMGFGKKITGGGERGFCALCF
ncbi:MAG: hypothetical protein MPL62_00140 [Alphaproteobacteria bacterium]|nr:hypothetical protein [Alphaproteobacteria bacterium]